MGIVWGFLGSYSKSKRKLAEDLTGSSVESLDSAHLILIYTELLLRVGKQELSIMEVGHITLPCDTVSSSH